MKYRLLSIALALLLLCGCAQEKVEISSYSGMEEGLMAYVAAGVCRAERFAIEDWARNAPLLAGQDENSICLYRIESPKEETRTLTFWQVSREDMTVEREMTMEVAWSEAYTDEELFVKETASGMMIVSPEQIYTFSLPLCAPKKVDRPAFLVDTAAQQRENGTWGGYDVSEDLTKFVFADAQGLHLYLLEVAADELQKRVEDRYWTQRAGQQYTGPAVMTGEDTVFYPAASEKQQDGESDYREQTDGNLMLPYGRPRFVNGSEKVSIEEYETGRTLFFGVQEAAAPDYWLSELPWYTADEEPEAAFPDKVDTPSGVFWMEKAFVSNSLRFIDLTSDDSLPFEGEEIVAVAQREERRVWLTETQEYTLLKTLDSQGEAVQLLKVRSGMELELLDLFGSQTVLCRYTTPEQQGYLLVPVPSETADEI